MAAWGRFLSRHILEAMVFVILAADGMLVWKAIILWGRFLNHRQTAQTLRHHHHALQELAGRLSQHGVAADLNAGVLSAERLQQQFLEELGPWVREAEFPVTVKPQPLQREGTLIRVMTELEVEATQDHLVKFLDRVLDDSSLVGIERFRLTPSGVTTAPVRATFVLSKLMLQAVPQGRPESSEPPSVTVHSSVEPTSSIATAASRPLFHTGGRTVALSTQPRTEQGRAVAGRLQVVGMITGSPSQAILEDAQTHKTHVVGVGQSVGEGIIVEAIQPHSVVLSVGGESHELPW